MCSLWAYVECFLSDMTEGRAAVSAARRRRKRVHYSSSMGRALLILFGEGGKCENATVVDLIGWLFGFRLREDAREGGRERKGGGGGNR